jgi:hypothetical protein
MLGTLYQTDKLTFWAIPLTRMGFRGPRVERAQPPSALFVGTRFQLVPSGQIPPSRLVKRSILLQVRGWAFLLLCTLRHLP